MIFRRSGSRRPRPKTEIVEEHSRHLSVGVLTVTPLKSAAARNIEIKAA